MNNFNKYVLRTYYYQFLFLKFAFFLKETKNLKLKKTQIKL